MQHDNFNCCFKYKILNLKNFNKFFELQTAMLQFKEILNRIQNEIFTVNSKIDSIVENEEHEGLEDQVDMFTFMEELD